MCAITWKSLDCIPSMLLPCEVPDPLRQCRMDCKRCSGWSLSCLCTLFQYSSMLLLICNCILNFPLGCIFIRWGWWLQQSLQSQSMAVFAATLPLGKACCFPPWNAAWRKRLGLYSTNFVEYHLKNHFHPACSLVFFSNAFLKLAFVLSSSMSVVHTSTGADTLAAKRENRFRKSCLCSTVSFPGCTNV